MLWLIVIFLEDEVIQKAFTTVFRIVVLEKSNSSTLIKYTKYIKYTMLNYIKYTILNILCRQN